MQATAMTLPEQRRFNPAPLLIFIVAIVMLIVASHAVEKHGADALAVQNCIKNGGLIQRWFNPYNEHKIMVCQMPDGRFGLQIKKKDCGRWCEITAYIKNRAVNLDELKRYLQGQDAILEWTK